VFFNIFFFNLRKWFERRNHKDIGMLYFVFGFYSGILGTSFSLIVRLELAKPGFLSNNGQLYNCIITAHALLIIFFYSNTHNSWWVW